MRPAYSAGFDLYVFSHGEEPSSMKPAPFDYHAPTTVEETLSLLAEQGGDVKLLAGGQSLVPAMNFRIMQPSVLIDLNAVEELTYIEAGEDGAVHIGAMTRQSAAERHPLVAERLPLLHAALPLIAHPQIRNRGTIGGSMVHADPAAELPVVAVAAGAEMRIKNAEGDRWVEAQEFFQGMFTTVVGPDEVLVAVRFPAAEPRSGWSFKELARRSGDYALAGVAAGVVLAEDGTCREARLVYLNVGDGPIRAQEAEELLRGEENSRALFEAAAENAAQQEITPYGNVHASPDYQQHLAKVLTVRALAEAWEQAESQLN